MKKLLILSLFIFTSDLFAKEFKYLARSPRALLMGDAFTAVANDEYTLFYNPAAMGRHKGIHITMINPKAELPDVLSKNVKKLQFSLDGKYKDWPKEPAAITNRILGTPLHLGAAITPTVKFENFAFTWLNSSTTDLTLLNATHPSLDINYRYDRGFLIGAGFPIIGKGGDKASNQLSAGITLKKIDRSSLDGDFDLFGTELLQIVENSDSYKDIRRSLGYSKGTGWGWDVGLEQVFSKGPSTWILGLSILDIGDTRFNKEDGIDKIPDQKMATNFGTSFNQDFGFFDYTLAVDFSPIYEPQTDFLTKLKMGFKASIPGFEFLMGVNGGYWSYGVSVNAFFMKLTVGFYGVEAGRGFKDFEAERIIFTLNLLDIGFDP
ncbi:MAG: hypothetical protein CL678_02380 [Bdellovibrionaceae bacterium]|nr:hypothetical protein [Halobacteriovorax sp.]MBN20107.1 hypothetical protein [Pseudobdellovibrionaceae bacterium]|tara:strand:- start:41178 stop:42311 length:1134 start_codon:yes stop_codon:yes gene_type:complete